MADRPYTLLSCGMSHRRLPRQRDRRAAAAVQRRRLRPGRRGAGRLRRDPGRRRHGPQRQPAAARPRRRPPGRAGRAAGLPTSPMKVTVTGTRGSTRCADFFTTGDSEKLVYCATDAVAAGPRAARAGGDRDRRRPAGASCGAMSEDLHDRGVRGSWSRAAAPCTPSSSPAGLADELHLVVAPFFVGDSRARRFVERRAVPVASGPARAPWSTYAAIGDVVLLRYALSHRFEWTEGEAR